MNERENTVVFSIRDYTDVKKLGSGSFGEVYEVERVSDNVKFAKKKVELNNVNHEQLVKAKREGDMLIGCDHPYIVKYYYMFPEAHHIHFIMELCANNNMKDYCMKQYPDHLPAALVWKWTLQLALALEHLHLKKLIHRDIKQDNVLINEFEDCKLGDFGLVYHETAGYTTNRGSFIYQPPELSKNSRNFSDKSDMWAMGCVVHFMCSYQHPFPTDLHAYFSSIDGKDMPKRILDSRYSPILQDLVDKLLCYDSSSRLSALQLLQICVFQVVEISRKLNVPPDQMERFYESFTSDDLYPPSNDNDDTRVCELNAATSGISHAWECTLLRLAARNGNGEYVEKLLQLSPLLVNVRNCRGWTPIYWTVTYGDWNIVQILLKYGATVEMETNKGRTPIHVAAFFGKTEVVEKLLEQFPKLVDRKEKGGWSALHMAVQEGHLETVKTLIRLGASIDLKDNEGWTPIHVAALNGKTEIVKELLKPSPALVNVKNNVESSPLHFAAERGHFDTVEILIDRGAKVDMINTYGNNPLHVAAYFGKTQVVDKLLQVSPALVNTKNFEKCTALHFAAEKGYLRVLKILLTNGASVQEKNKLGKTALQLAERLGRKKVTKELKRASRGRNV